MRPQLVALVALVLASGCTEENRQPTLDPIPSQEVRVGETLRLHLTGRDPDNDPLLFKATPKPLAAYFEDDPNGAIFTWPPLISDTGPTGRTHEITFTVEDERGGIAARTVKITVLPQSNAPVFVGALGQILNLSADDDISFTVGVKDDDSAEVTFRVIGEGCGAGCPPGHECRQQTCQLQSSRFQRLDSKTASFYWKPTDQQRALGNYWQLVVGAKDEAHDEVIQKISILLMNGDEGKDCPGTPPAFVPCADASCVPVPDLINAGAIVLRAQGVDQESEIREMRFHYATSNPLDPGSYKGHVVDMTRCEPLDDPSCPTDIGSRYFVGVMPNPAALATEPLLVYYYLVAKDNDDIKGTGCDHTTRFPKEGHHTLAAYPTAWQGGCKDDPNEPNDTQATATPISPGVTYDLRTCVGGGARDWYRMDVQPGAIISAELLHDPRHGALELTLRDAAGTVLATPGDVAVAAPNTSPVYLEVAAPAGAIPSDQTYGLAVSRTFGGCLNDDLEPNDTPELALLLGPSTHKVVICPGDRDWVKVSAHKDESIVLDLDFQHAFGDLDLYLYDSAKNLLDSSETATSREQVIWSVDNAADTFYVEVRGYLGQTNTGTLQMQVVPTNTLCFEDYLSPNHIAQQAYLLPENVYEDLSMCSGKEDWFRIDVNPGETVQILAQPYFPDEPDLDLLAFGPDGKAIVGQALNPGDEYPAGSVAWEAANLDAGPLLWRLRTSGQVTVLFDMLFSVSDPPGECQDDRFSPTNTVKNALDVDQDAGFVTRLKICPGGQDWFRIQGKAFEQLYVYVYGFEDEGPMTASLHRFDGADLIHVADGVPTTDGVEILHLPEANHEYYIHVTGQPGQVHHYDLVMGLQ